jgi:hypothetical protein
MIDNYEDAYEVGFKKIIIDATQEALSNLRLDWRFQVDRYSRPEDGDQLWRIYFFDFDKNRKRVKGFKELDDPYNLPDEKWYTWCVAEITRLLHELIHTD